MDKNNYYSLEIKTVQSSAFKVLIEALKELLTDTVIEFTKDGIKIITTDNSHVILIHLKLHADKFEYYHCDKDVKIGINMLNFYKVIKTINSNDTLTLFMHKDDNNKLGVRIENGEKNNKTTFEINLIELDHLSYDIPPVEFNSVITMPSSDFQKIIRDMHNIADYVEIKNTHSEFIISCEGDFCRQETILCDNDFVSIKNEGEPHDIIQGVFSLKYLFLFTKCSNLSNHVLIYLQNAYPLVLTYSVASLGDIKLCLTQIVNEEN
jgi:proliferating cell nuclear antigen